MKVLAIPADGSACAFYRLKAPAAAVTALGVDIEVVEPRFPQHTSQGTVEAPVRIDPDGADVIICHRPSFPALVTELERLQAQGHAIVVDVDDDLGSLPRKGKQAALAERSQMAACQMADLVTCSTPALAERYGTHGRVQILRNCVPASMLEMSRESDGSTLGWAGLASGHLGDLPTTGGAVADALEGSGWTFQVVGPAETVRQELGLTSAPRATGALRLAKYQQAIGLLDVGIAPLAISQFTVSKSHLKPLEMASRGVACVVAATPEYRRLGAGLVAEDARQWRRHLTDLIRDESLRCEVAMEGRHVAEANTYETNADLWLEAWQTAIDRRN